MVPHLTTALNGPLLSLEKSMLDAMALQNFHEGFFGGHLHGGSPRENDLGKVLRPRKSRGASGWRLGGDGPRR